MFRERSQQKELMDGTSFSVIELQQNLDEIARCNHWFGSRKLLLRLLQKVYKSNQSQFHQKQISLADIGCGRGDLLHAVASWGDQKKMKMDLCGVDNNAATLDYARKHARTNFSFVQGDIFSEAFSKQEFDMVVLNSVCHHFSTPELIRLLEQLKKQTKFAIVINDLHRHAFPYYAIKLATKLLRFSKLSQHDGPLSVLRAFTRKDLIYVLRAAQIDDYQLSWAWPFRWGLIIPCEGFRD